MTNFPAQRVAIFIGDDPAYTLPVSGGYAPNDDSVLIKAQTAEMGKGSVVLESWTGWDDGVTIEYNSAQKLSGDGELMSRYGSIKGRDLSFTFSIHLSESQMRDSSMNNIKRIVDALSLFSIKKHINVYRWQSTSPPFHPATRPTQNAPVILSPVDKTGKTAQFAVRERFDDSVLRYLGHSDYITEGRVVTFTLNFRLTDSSKKQVWTLPAGVNPLVTDWTNEGTIGT